MDTNMDSNANASARFLVQFLPENPPYCEHDAYAEHHGNVADLDIETANPYFVEIDTSFTLPSLFRKPPPPEPKKVSSNPPPGPAQHTLGPQELKKQAQIARQTARQEEQRKMREESVKNANRKMENRQRSTEKILEQQRRTDMENDGSALRASNFRSGRSKGNVNPKTTIYKRSFSRTRLGIK